MLRQPFCGLENPNWGFLESKQGKYIINFFILNFNYNIIKNKKLVALNWFKLTHCEICLWCW